MRRTEFSETAAFVGTIFGASVLVLVLFLMLF